VISPGATENTYGAGKPNIGHWLFLRAHVLEDQRVPDGYLSYGTTPAGMRRRFYLQ
jgi:hypothetical protein